MFELFKDSRVVFMVLCFSCQLGELCDIMINVARFHFQFVELCCCFIMGIRIVPILDEILLKFFPHVYVGGGRYRPPHDPVFHTSFPLGNSSSLYKGKGVCDFAVGIGHNVGVGIKELVEFEFVHELIGLCSIA